VNRRGFLLAAAALSASASLPAAVAAAAEHAAEPTATLFRGEIGKWAGVRLVVAFPAEEFVHGRRFEREVQVVAGFGAEIPLNDEIVGIVQDDYRAGFIESYHFEIARDAAVDLAALPPLDERFDIVGAVVRRSP